MCCRFPLRMMLKIVTSPAQEIRLLTLLSTAWDWSVKWNLPINPAKCNHLKIRRDVPLSLPFFSGESCCILAPNCNSCAVSDTLICVSKLAKDRGVQADNAFLPSARSTGSVNRARLLQRSFEIRFHFIILGTGAVIPRL